MNPRSMAIAAAAALALAGCSPTITDGEPHGDQSAQRSTELGALLLTPDEADAAMHTSGLAVDTTTSTMIDDSRNVEPAACLPVASVTQDQEYARSDWSAMHVQSLHEPGETFDHLLHQAVVEFPAPQDAAAFYTTSIDTWAACTGTYTYTPTGVVWNVGESGEAAGTLIASTSQQGANWLCSRALTAAANLVVDVLTCSSDALSAMTAHTVAAEIAARASTQ